jgi:hypothetical protein
MAKIVLNTVFREARGSLNGLTFRRMHGRQTLIKKPDMSNVKWSEAQKAHRERFRDAVAYARRAMADPAVRARYEGEALAKGKRPFDMAVSDHFKGRDLLNEG